MIYLCRGHERAVCETEARAQAREAQGYRRCSAEVHRGLWRRFDQITLMQMYVTVEIRSIEQEQAASVLPPGFRTFHIR